MLIWNHGTYMRISCWATNITSTGPSTQKPFLCHIIITRLMGMFYVRMNSRHCVSLSMNILLSYFSFRFLGKVLAFIFKQPSSIECIKKNYKSDGEAKRALKLTSIAQLIHVCHIFLRISLPFLRLNNMYILSDALLYP